MMAALLYLQAASAAAELAPFWELAKGLMLFVTTACVGFIAKMLWTMRDLVKEHDRDLYGRDGKSGAIARVTDVEGRLSELEDRFTAIDAVEEHQRDEYHGPERRRGARRSRDLIHDEDTRPPEEGQ